MNEHQGGYAQVTLGLFVYCVLRYRRVPTILSHGRKWHAIGICLAGKESLEMTQVRSCALLRKEALR